MSRLTTNHD